MKNIIAMIRRALSRSDANITTKAPLKRTGSNRMPLVMIGQGDNRRLYFGQ